MYIEAIQELRTNSQWEGAKAEKNKYNAAMDPRY